MKKTKLYSFYCGIGGGLIGYSCQNLNQMTHLLLFIIGIMILTLSSIKLFKD